MSKNIPVDYKISVINIDPKETICVVYAMEGKSTGYIIEKFSYSLERGQQIIIQKLGED